MFPFRRSFAFLLLISGQQVAAQPSDQSANSRMPACRNYVQQPDKVSSAQDAFDRGMCAGIVRALVETDSGVCPPKGARQEQAMRIVVKYIDSRPARTHQSFIALAAEALRVGWPCKP